MSFTCVVALYRPYFTAFSKRTIVHTDYNSDDVLAIDDVCCLCQPHSYPAAAEADAATAEPEEAAQAVAGADALVPACKWTPQAVSLSALL